MIADSSSPSFLFAVFFFFLALQPVITLIPVVAVTAAVAAAVVAIVVVAVGQRSPPIATVAVADITVVITEAKELG